MRYTATEIVFDYTGCGISQKIVVVFLTKQKTRLGALPWRGGTGVVEDQAGVKETRI
jgi:hypothetical protein